MLSYLMGIDLGTSGVKAIICDFTGNIMATSSKVYDVHMPASGYAEQEAISLWRATAQAIKETIHLSGIKPCHILSIGLSGQMHGLVPLDRQYHPIRPVIIWMDQRSKNEKRQLEENPAIQEATLNAPGTGFYISSLLWMKNHEPDSFEQISVALLPKDYIRYMLCGEIGTDYSDASGTMIFDTANRQWLYALAEQIGIESNLFPQCHCPTDIAGYISADCADETGLAVGTPVIYGGGDQPMHSVGNGIVQPGMISTNIGTACQVSTVTEKVVRDELLKLNIFCHIPDNMWTLVGASLNGGSVLKWLRKKVLHIDNYKTMNQYAADIKAGSEGLLFLPYLSGERTPHMDPDAKGIFSGLTLKHTDKHFIRAVMEGITFSLKDSLELFGNLGIDGDRIVTSGGGAKSKVWMQMQADILERPIITTRCMEQGCLGAAISAGVGIKVFHSLAEGCQEMIQYNNYVIEPDRHHLGLYREQFKKYKLLYQKNKDLF